MIYGLLYNREKYNPPFPKNISPFWDRLKGRKTLAFELQRTLWSHYKSVYI
jgi:hypothetical protein